MIVYRTINGVKFGINVNKAAGLLCSENVAREIDGDIYEFVEFLYKQKNEYTPMIATWEITNCCNYKCPFCYINTPAKPIPKIQNFSGMKRYIDELVDTGLLLVYLTGGEVLSVPDFEYIYRYLKNKGVFVVILSNLSLLNERHIALFKEYPPLRITSSIYGLTNKQFTAVTGVSYEYCQKVLNNILSLKKLGITITCQMPVNKFTVEDFIAIADWCYENDIRFTYSNEITDSYYNESRSESFLDDDTFKLLTKNIKQVELQKSTKITKPERIFGYKHHFSCIAGKHTYAISYDCHLRPCFNIWENDLKSFDGSISMKKAMEEMSRFILDMQKEVIEGCSGCDASSICNECIYTHLKHKTNLNEYIHRKCEENRNKICELCSSLS